ncbi:MAG: hypothetical protein ACOWWH_07240 [Eubacteriaceae bacterium]
MRKLTIEEIRQIALLTRKEIIKPNKIKIPKDFKYDRVFMQREKNKYLFRKY